jgi:hypothetical protein
MLTKRLAVYEKYMAKPLDKIKKVCYNIITVKDRC